MKIIQNIRKKKYLLRAVFITGIAVFLTLIFVIVSNVLIVNIQGKKIVTGDKAAEYNAQCILILGAGVKPDNSPSSMLEDRLLEGIGLYKKGVAPKIIVSGDHGRSQYDEVNVMKRYLTDAGIPDSDIFMDHAGFSTYESMVRAKEIFGVSRMVVVSQEYHLYRALYICGQIGIDAVGVSSDARVYVNQKRRDLRELLARDKAIFTCLFNVKPTYLGEKIDIAGDGNVTNDCERQVLFTKVFIEKRLGKW